jgi:molybdopterin/thiamine biosynthesis adenylyltransferase
MHDDIRYSRPLATAARLGDDAKDGHRFLDKHVLLTGDAPVLSTQNGRECLLDSLRLLVRICRNVTVFIPPGFDALLRECRSVAARINYDQDIEFPDLMPDPAGFDAVLSVGTIARPDLPWTVINSNGWLARVSSGNVQISSECDQANPVGALAAACLGVTEVFKRLIQLRGTRGRYFDGLTFSLYSYQVGTSDPGPELPTDIYGDLLVVGAGAIGNGIVHLLSKLRLHGHVAIVDAQQFGPENLGTCILIGLAEIGLAKAAIAEAVLREHGISAKGYREELADFRTRLGREIPFPRVVVNGLDNIETRHQVQHLWSDLAIDGAIGDFGCQVSRHPWGPDVACMLCLFRDDPGQLADDYASNATGLNLLRVRQAEERLTEDDVTMAPAEKQTWLRERVGRQICSVIQEAVAQDLSAAKQREGFRPSVPFVACLSASMVVGELLKYWIGLPSPLEPRYQLDVLRGPEWGLEVPQERRRNCICVTRAHNIESVRGDFFGAVTLPR